MVNALGVDTFVINEGFGQPVLFLHGAPDSADMWRGVIEQLNGRFHCIAPDLPGFGRSVAPDEFDFSLDNQARWVDAVVETLNIRQPINLVMHDFGGHFGLAWAIKTPHKVRRLVISNTNFFSDYQWHASARIFRTPVLGEIGITLTTYKAMCDAMRTGSPNIAEEHIRHAFDQFTLPVRKQMLRLYRASDPENFRGWEDQLPALTQRVPTMVLWGDQDPYAPTTYAERFGAQIVHHFPNCGHWVCVEAAAETAEKLHTFLQ